MKYDNRSGSSARVALTGERSAIRTSDTRIRDSGKVQVGGIIKRLPVSRPSAAIQDPGMTRVGGIIRKSPKK